MEQMHDGIIYSKLGQIGKLDLGSSESEQRIEKSSEYVVSESSACGYSAIYK